MGYKTFFKYLIASILIVAILRHLFTTHYLGLIKNVSPGELLLSILIAFVLFTLSGTRYYYILKKYHHTKFLLQDISLFPIMMNLWGYLLPTQGSLIFSTLFLKYKYQVTIRRSFSINLYIYLFSVVLTGAIGLYYTVSHQMYYSPISIVSMFFLFSPVIIVIMTKLLAGMHFLELFKILKTLQEKMSSLLGELNSFWLDPKLNITLFFLNIVHLIVTYLWFFEATIVFDLALSNYEIIMLALISRLALIFKFTPGNLGVTEVAAGGALHLLGGNFSEGVICTLFFRFTTLLIASIVGGFATIYNMQYVKLKEIKRMLKTNG